MDLLKVIEENPSLKGSFIEEVFTAMQEGKVNNNLPPLHNDREVIGKMNRYEIALHFISKKNYDLMRKEEKKLERAFALSEEFVEGLENIAHYITIGKRAHDFMWESIRKRLPHHDEMRLKEGHLITSPDKKTMPFSLN